MLDQALNEILQVSDGKSPFYSRNLAKEEIQNYILNFTYQHPVFQNLIFTGGTCLRKLYGLDRLSEDLDFDYISDFDIKSYLTELKKYFVSQLKYKKVEFKVSNNMQTLFIKFPVYSLFVRCDFSLSVSKAYGINKGTITAGQYNFLVNAYDLETMFANKIVAFLKRNFYKGKFQTLPFKGRDVYDLFWLLQLSARNSYKLKPNRERLEELTENSLEVLKQDVKNKIKKVDTKFVYEDVLPLVETDEYLKQFLQIFHKSISKQIDLVM